MSAINQIQENTFSAACYNNSCLYNLKDLRNCAADIYDMAQWNLTEAEWREQIEIAIAALEEKAAE